MFGNPFRSKSIPTKTVGICERCRALFDSDRTECPSCGSHQLEELHIPQPTSSPDRNDKSADSGALMEVDNGVRGVAGILGVVGFITLFLFLPVGIVMLIAAGAMRTFLPKEKSVPAIQGTCPKCSNLINVQDHVLAANCPICLTRFMSRDGKFIQL